MFSAFRKGKYDSADVLMSAGVSTFVGASLVLITPRLGILFIEIVTGLFLIGCGFRFAKAAQQSHCRARAKQCRRRKEQSASPVFRSLRPVYRARRGAVPDHHWRVIAKGGMERGQPAYYATHSLWNWDSA
jgi:hypothetical protein